MTWYYPTAIGVEGFKIFTIATEPNPIAFVAERFF
jgi:hypothetical protein